MLPTVVVVEDSSLLGGKSDDDGGAADGLVAVLERLSLLNALDEYEWFNIIVKVVVSSTNFK